MVKYNVKVRVLLKDADDVVQYEETVEDDVLAPGFSVFVTELGIIMDGLNGLFVPLGKVQNLNLSLDVVSVTLIE